MAEIQNNIGVKVRQINIIEEEDLYAQVLKLRNEQLYKKVGLNIYNADLSAEKDFLIIAALTSQPEAGSKPFVVGCVILQAEDDGTTFRLRQMAVHQNYQRQNIGRRIIDTVESITKSHLRSRIILHAQKRSQDFYLKLGYVITSDEFIEVNIPHYQMEKKL